MISSASFIDGASELLFGKRGNGLCLLVCGGRDYKDERTLYIALDAVHKDPGITEIIQGGARGADMLALQYARARSIMCTTFHANWEWDKKAAGPIRNQRMIDEGKPNFVLAFPGGTGTADMVRRARKAKIEVFEIKGELA